MRLNSAFLGQVLRNLEGAAGSFIPPLLLPVKGFHSESFTHTLARVTRNLPSTQSALSLSFSVQLFFRPPPLYLNHHLHPYTCTVVNL